MKKLFNLFTLLLCFSFIFSSCGKDDDEVVTPETGSIKATVSPAGSATNMRITQGTTTLEITPNSSGVFQADNLQAGAYSVSFTAAVGFQAPPARNVTVTGGETADLGTVTLSQPGNLFLGSMSANVDGTPWNSVIHAATMDSTSLTITGTLPSLSGSAQVIALNIANITGPGTFTSATGATGIYTVASAMGGGGGGAQNIWISAGPGTNCSVTITNFNQATQKVSGNFSFTANAAPGSTATGTKTITNGIFTNLTIQ